MAVPLVFGLAFSMILVLFFIPAYLHFTRESLKKSGILEIQIPRSVSRIVFRDVALNDK